MSFLFNLILCFRPYFFLHVLFKLPLCQCNFSFSDWHSLTLLCFLSFFLSSFHSFFLPLAWPIDLAVQGCKYHCGLFHSCPSTFTSIHTPILTCIKFLHFELLGHLLHGRFHTILPSRYSSLHLTVCFNLLMHTPYSCLISIRKAQSVIVIALCTLDCFIKVTGISRIWQGVTLTLLINIVLKKC